MFGLKLFTLKKFFTTKKNIYFLAGGAALLVLFLLLIILFAGRKPVLYTFAELSGPAKGEVQHLFIREGSSGEQLLVEEGQSIDRFLDMLSPLTFFIEGDGETKPGWTHMVMLHRDEKNYLRLVFAGEEVEFSFFERGLKVYEKRFVMSADITQRLEEYFNRELEARDAALKAAEPEPEPDPEPVEITLQEIEPAICVVINNHPSARPSSGLQQADIVYEFLVEGGSTRYLAVFRTKHLEDFLIGPVRSLRPYFAVQSLDYGGIVAHSGYSVRTMQMISGLGIFQIGDVGNNFWRDNTRRAPHNLYTCIDNLYRVSLARIEAVERTYMLQSEPEAEYETGISVEIRYSGHNKVNYIYDEEAGVYYRFINDNPHTDRETGEQYYADRVIIRETSHRNVPGPEGLVDIDLHGSGEGLLYEHGRKYSVTWERPGRETKYFYGPDQPVEPIAGTTWIQVVRR